MPEIKVPENEASEIKVAFLGLGVMGYPMAGHLARAGYAVTVYNRTTAKAEAWVEDYSAQLDDTAEIYMAPTVAGAVADADFVFACVGADKDVAEVCIGDNGAFASMKSGSVFVDHTTASAECARDMYAAAKEAGIGFLDAPVSGGEAGAVNGVLTVMCGGDDAVFNRAESVIAAFSKSCKLLGGAGAGQLTKMANQVCIAGIVQGLSEALNLAMEAGLDANAVVDVISKGAAQSWQMENRASTMINGEFDFGFAVDWMRKDLGIVLNEANNLGVSMPLTALVDQFYADVQKMGGNRQDTSSLIRRFRG
ncbi:NAD(P)-dependent oxidoreductase [Kordiimonas sp. SCSIO 12610]|uniref:NAD(P)-dependent oxidoreductase n=1 Tax=Kordiimonas sp. SCSIO 12610 TaxID=2829597 RepID=UPI00210B87A0|nr:NAD(P)-dependent oxidoreductase [Kordiimonas sp. SCSIO 12610]UTW56684.1 NAD(P)-dependent oxidoreductase [Kordiimonas sp. SCSIO 12610]